MASPVPVVINEMLYELGNSFVDRVNQVHTLPPGVRTCLGAISPSITPSGLQGTFMNIHIRPHDFLNDVLFLCNLQSMLRYARDLDLAGVTSAPYIIFAFLECIRRHLCKEKVYWKIIDYQAGSFEIYV